MRTGESDARARGRRAAVIAFACLIVGAVLGLVVLTLSLQALLDHPGGLGREVPASTHWRIVLSTCAAFAAPTVVFVAFLCWSEMRACRRERERLNGTSDEWPPRSI